MDKKRRERMVYIFYSEYERIVSWERMRESQGSVAGGRERWVGILYGRYIYNVGEGTCAAIL